MPVRIDLPENDNPDAVVENHGSITLLRPVTQAAVEWIEDHLPKDRMTFGDAVVIEHRFVLDIVVGMKEDGLVITNRKPQ